MARRRIGVADIKAVLIAWDAGEPDTGWFLRLAIADPRDRLAWAVAATDSK